jgi:hypothetical protein
VVAFLKLELLRCRLTKAFKTNFNNVITKDSKISKPSINLDDYKDFGFNYGMNDYYFVDGLDKVKDNGVVAFITSTGVMDKVDSKIRQEIVSKADVIGAYRLPAKTFSKNAHTDVVTDIVFLQKRPDGVASRMEATNEAFVKSKTVLVQTLQKRPLSSGVIASQFSWQGLGIDMFIFLFNSYLKNFIPIFTRYKIRFCCRVVSDSI